MYIHLGSKVMRRTKAFQNGNSQAVRIPADIAYANWVNMELEIERIGEEIRIRPARCLLTKVLDKFAEFIPHFMEEGRGDQEQAERERW
jgi:antitoxin VapB